MKKKLCVILTIILIFAIGCETKNTVLKPKVEKIKATIPFDERKFIYTNGLKIELKEVNTTDEKGVKVRNNYPVISGLKDKSVQDKINKELEGVGIKLLTQLEANLISISQKYLPKIDQKYTSTYISYNCNNVIFVEYYANIEIPSRNSYAYPNYKSASYGYDLNTGEKISLDDVFKPDTDYRTKINNFICQYIIENNYDDYESERMLKPFQGIRENQSFSFDTNGLRIILDDKNDEFNNNGYFDQIQIPLNYIGEDLYIFDKYFTEGKSIFEKEKLSKKLLPNELEFKVNNTINEGNEKYSIHIVQGEFIKVPNKDIAKKLNEMVVANLNVEDFRERVKADTVLNGNSYFGGYEHFISIFTNAGGYLSMAVSDEIMGNVSELERIPFNYDFNLNKEILLEDIFVYGTDIVKVIKTYIERMNYPISDEALEKYIEEAVKTDKFYFNEYGVGIYFSPKDIALENYSKWVFIPYEEFGIENVSLFN